LSLLTDTLHALEKVVDHVDEDTGFFPDHRRLIMGWHGLERSLDGELARLNAPAESPSIPPGSGEFAGCGGRVRRARSRRHRAQLDTTWSCLRGTSNSTPISPVSSARKPTS
jgi:hypothetical protein